MRGRFNLLKNQNKIMQLSTINFEPATIPHPRKTIVQSFPVGGRRTRKYDGEFSVIELAGCTVLAERVTAKSGAFLTAEDRALIAQHGAFYAAFDVVSHDGQSVRHFNTAWRVDILNQILPPSNIRPQAVNGFVPVILAETVTESAEAVMARGGEGVCWQDWSAPYGEMQVIKAAEIFVCKVTGRSAGQSVFIADAATGEARGAVALRGGKCDQVRAGSIIRVEGMGLTDAGKIRQPNPCREWLVSY